MENSDWDLPPADLVDDPTPISVDDTEQVNPPKNACPVCGEPVIRMPGQRGRVAKYHPECKPVKGSVSAPARTVRVSKADQVAAEQTELIIEQVRRGLAKAVALLSLADPYDAFVLHVNSPDILDNLRPVLLRWEWARNQALSAGTGGSLLGLIITLFTTALPILAHHNLIRKGKVSRILVQMPVFMLRLQERIAEGGDGNMSEELLRRVGEQQKKAQEAAMRAATVEESPNGGVTR